jgi:hypothetical protein
MTKQYSLSEFEISFDRIENNWNKIVTPKLDEELQILYREIPINPSESIVKLEKLKIQYSNIPKIDNFLSIAYSMNGNEEKSELIIKESYEKFPDYLFSRLNYAEVCLSNGEFDKIPIILDHKFDLKLLYPKRNKFHVSEVIGFYGIVGKYSFCIGKENSLRVCYDLLKILNKRHKNTIILKKMLRLVRIKKLFSIIGINIGSKVKVNNHIQK